jgi:hypothetical protein
VLLDPLALPDDPAPLLEAVPEAVIVLVVTTTPPSGNVDEPTMTWLLVEPPLAWVELLPVPDPAPGPAPLLVEFDPQATARIGITTERGIRERKRMTAP